MSQRSAALWHQIELIEILSDFSRPTKDLNLQLYMRTVCGMRSIHIQSIFYLYFLRKIFVNSINVIGNVSWQIPKLR